MSTRLTVATPMLAILLAPTIVAAQATSRASLPAFNQSVQALVRRVAPSVVQIVATGYFTVDQGSGNVLARQQSIGSGVVIDRDGYIMTNQHVVQGASQVQVVLATASLDQSPESVLASTRERTAVARVVGFSRDLDLALLKVDTDPLPALPIADYDALRQGEVVFAFGSPAGLSQSVTMGVVSAVARQSTPDDPHLYIQTDAPINRGNSGGPLVNANGELVGLNTFIVSASGGNEGLGFAIPSAVVSLAFPALRAYGKIHRGSIGVEFQTITPDLAGGLGLRRRQGVIVSDVQPGGPADTAGLKIGDVVTAADGRPVELLSSLLFRLYTRGPGDVVTLEISRGTAPLTIAITEIERPRVDTLTDLVDPSKSLVASLGILGIGIDDRVAALLPNLREPGGVLIVAKVQDWRAADVSLSPGDIIHSVNTTPVTTLQSLRVALDAAGSGSPVVLQVERNGTLSFVTFTAP